MERRDNIMRCSGINQAPLIRSDSRGGLRSSRKSLLPFLSLSAGVVVCRD